MVLCRRPWWCLALFLLVSLFLSLSARSAVPPDTLAQRLAACTSCHARSDTTHGTAYFPRIAGKPPGYLYNQLINFRDGRRQYPVMAYMVTHLPEAYLQEIAGYFAALPPTVHPAVTGSASLGLLERGRVLATQGDSARKVPACIACHGQALAGTLPTVPGLVGLPRDYVNAQFGAWRNGTRRAAAPDCMAAIAARLSLDDIHAVSTWLANRPFAPDARPAPALAHPLPLQCGSVP